MRVWFDCRCYIRANNLNTTIASLYFWVVQQNDYWGSILQAFQSFIEIKKGLLKGYWKLQHNIKLKLKIITLQIPFM